MPTPAYISIEGATQGNITAGSFTAESVGNVYVEGHEDEMSRGDNLMEAVGLAVCHSGEKHGIIVDDGY